MMKLLSSLLKFQIFIYYYDLDSYIFLIVKPLIAFQTVIFYSSVLINIFSSFESKTSLATIFFNFKIN